MKKILLEYANIIGYTITGLVFGLGFFLLFINFYHAKELSETVDISTYMATSRENASNKLQQIKENAAVYNQATYNGSEDIFNMNSMQIRINSCVTIFESEEGQSFLNKDKITIQDAYRFNQFFQNEVLNDCVVMQLNTLGETSSSVGISSLSSIRPFIRLNIDYLLSAPSYVGNTIQNADAYYVSNDVNRNSIFDLTRDSYYATMNNYQQSLDLLLEISNWYKNLVIGG